MKYMFCARPDDLMRRLLEEKLHIVHFSGHGNADGQLCFEHPSGRSWPADKAAIAEIFGPSRRYVKCVLLNACFSAEQAQLIGQHVEYTIGSMSSVTDDAAVAMARGFYGALGTTGRVSQAISAARANLHLASSDQDLYCARRVPEFLAFASQAVDTDAIASELDEQPARMPRLVAGDVDVPLPFGSRSENIPEFFTYKAGGHNATFVVSEAIAKTHASYMRWARRDGWVIIGDASVFEDMTTLMLGRGMHRVRFVWCMLDHAMILHIRVWQDSFAYRG